MLAGRISVGVALASLTFLVLAGSIPTSGRADTTQHWNGRIVYTPYYGGVVFMNPDGSGRLGGATTLPGDTGPAWSPDGTILAVSQAWQGTGGIRLEWPDGSTIEMLTNTIGDSSPTWSPDGTRIAYLNSGHLYAVSLSGGAATELGANDNQYKNTPAWSPDGTRIAFQTWGDTGPEIDVLDLASGKETQIASGYSPAWAPDGSRLAFTDVNGVVSLMDPDGSHVTPLVPGSVAAFSPDGQRIVFVRAQNVWTMSTAGTDLQQLTLDGVASESSPPAWQPLGPPPGGCTIWGTDAPDLLVGTNDDDVICGLGGNDTLIGMNGNDVLNGGDGNDYLAGGLGRDVLIGGPGNDTIDARDGDPDIVRGGGDPNDRAIVDGPQDVVKGARVTVSADIAAWRPVTASGSTPGQPALLAVDGRFNDIWNGGNYAPQWVEIDLRKPSTVARLVLVAPDNPTNAAVIVLGRGRGTGGEMLELARFRGATTDGEFITLTLRKPARGIRYLRVVTTGATTSYSAAPWVSWHEIEVFSTR